MRCIEDNNLDLFVLKNDYYLVQFMSQDCDMDNDIVDKFNEQFPEMKFKLKEIELPTTDIEFTCRCVLYQDIHTKGVFTLITKKKHDEQSTCSDLSYSLIQMKLLCDSQKIKKLAMYKCTLDNLDWGTIKQFIKHTFEDSDIEIVIIDKKG